MEKINIGIVGTGRIARRMAAELTFAVDAIAYAAYNPKMRSAQNFSKKYELVRAFDNYEAFLDNVDAVYVASPHETHYSYCKLALEAGKHVLCEKPMVLSSKEAKHLFGLAESKGLVLMEAIKTAYCPGFLSLLSIAESGRIGEIKEVEAAFTKLVPNEQTAREYDFNYGGSFTELASYTLLPVIKLLGIEYSELNFDYIANENGVDIYARTYFKYPGAMANTKTGIGVKSEGQLLVSGTNGYILARSPWWLTKSFEVCYENSNDNESFNESFPRDGLGFELMDFVSNIKNPELKDYKITREDSIALAATMEKFLYKRKAIG